MTCGNASKLHRGTDISGKSTRVRSVKETLRACLPLVAESKTVTKFPEKQRDEILD